jgi:peptidoglycan/LPS O-acetylase OafA/YrhL
MSDLRYRPEIDGLRAIAVIAVIAYHAGLRGFDGGFIGVDVFFVISGFLITQIIFKEHNSRGFSYLRFFERRARRLMPALFLVIVSALPFALLWMTPGELKIFGQSIGYTVLFVANLGLESEAGYFTDRADLYPFLHTWSLSVEEQFYLLFPTLLIFLSKMGNAKRWAILTAIWVLSFGLAEYRSEAAPNENFYFLTTRAWELLTGCLLAIAMGNRAPANIPGTLASLIGVALLVAGFVVFDDTTRHPSAWTLLPVVGTALIILGAHGASPVARALSLRPLVVIGLVSYPAYLWHQPLFAFARIRLGDLLPVWSSIALSFLAFVLAWLTWRLVEIPVRRGVGFSRAQVFAATGTLTACVVVTALILDGTDGLPTRFDARVATIAALDRDLPPLQEECHSTPRRTVPAAEACVYGASQTPTFAIWGDSHAMIMAEAFGTALEPHGLGVVDFTYRSCTPVLADLGPTTHEMCREYNRSVLERIIDDPAIRTVVLHARWPLVVEARPFDNGAGGIEGGLRVAVDTTESVLGHDSDTQAERLLAGLGEVVATLKSTGKDVVLFSGVPEAGWSLPDHMARRIILGTDTAEVSYARRVWDERNTRALSVLVETANRHAAFLFDPSDVVCGTGPDCVLSLGGLPKYFDDDHLTRDAASRVAAVLVQHLVGSGLLRH